MAEFPAWEIQAWMAFYSIEPWDLTNQAVKSFLGARSSTPAEAPPDDSDAAVLRWAQAHNARLLAKNKDEE